MSSNVFQQAMQGTVTTHNQSGSINSLNPSKQIIHLYGEGPPTDPQQLFADIHPAI